MILTHTKPGNHSSRLLATLSHQGTLVFTDDSSSSFFYFLRKYLYICVCVLSCFSHIRLFATLRTGACQAPLSMGFSRQEYWIGLSCPTPGDLPDPGIEPMSLTSPTLVGRFFTTSAAWEIPSLFIYFWLCWVFVAVWAFSSYGEWRPLSSCGTQRSLCGGFSCFRAQVLEHEFSIYDSWAQLLQGM